MTKGDDTLCTLLEDVALLRSRVRRLEERMTTIEGAEADLAAQVDATLTEITALEGQVSTLQAAVSAGDPAQIQAAADAIEAQVTKLKGAMPTPPAPAETPPATL